jgi:outer membrane protein OmpA-like peptidoglycan-associated protein
VTTPPLAPPAGPCTAASFPIYFETGSAQLTAPAREALAGSLRMLGGCKASRVQVLGLADADGGAQRNLALSQQRARVVAAAVAAAGLPAAEFDLEGLGEAGARTPQRRAEPLRRRAEVFISIAP